MFPAGGAHRRAAASPVQKADAGEQGRRAVVPDPYRLATERMVLPPWTVLTAVPRAMADAQGIIFFLLIVGGTIAVLRASSTIDAVLGWILRRLRHSPTLLIVVGTAIFAAGSSTLGASTESIPFAAVLVALCVVRCCTRSCTGSPSRCAWSSRRWPRSACA
jgi:uncharacterized ion transporter superfamily protein YfcC